MNLAVETKLSFFSLQIEMNLLFQSLGYAAEISFSSSFYCLGIICHSLPPVLALSIIPTDTCGLEQHKEIAQTFVL